MNKYSVAMIDEMKQAGTFDHASATAFATKYDLSPRSVIAKVKALGIDYKVKDAKQRTKTATKARLKADFLDNIGRILGVDFPSMKNMTISDLEDLEIVLERLAD